MTTVTIRVAASNYAADCFGPDAFAGQIGKTIPVGAPGGGGTGRLVAAEVVDGGRAAKLALECDESTSRRLSEVGPGECSFGFAPREGVTMTPYPVVAADD